MMSLRFTTILLVVATVFSQGEALRDRFMQHDHTDLYTAKRDRDHAWKKRNGDETSGSSGSSGDAEEANCPPGRKMYHVLMTAASGQYQEWQSRTAYYHYKKQKKLNPCSEMGGFTRLLGMPDGRADGMMDEIPTLLVKQLRHGAPPGGSIPGPGEPEDFDYHFIVMNRPWGMLQFLETEHYKVCLRPGSCQGLGLGNSAGLALSQVQAGVEESLALRL
ncbi:hypothetical protein CYMTET_36139, partial [Cymbomonas tetramitiformis]